MGTIVKRQTTDGKYRYRALVRVKRNGADFTQSKTFSKESLAKEWIKKTEAQIEIDDSFLVKKSINSSLGELILRYRDEVAGQYNSKYTKNLTRVASYPISKTRVDMLTRQDFSSFALWRLRGDDDNNGVTPSTIKGDFSFLAATIDYAITAWGLSLENTQFELQQAMMALRKRRVITNSKSLDRTPTNDELIALTRYFYHSWQRGRTTVPMHLVIWLAIYTTRRQDELMNLRLSDFDRHNNQWLVRDVKNPDGSTGNHKYAHLEPNALAMIDELLHPDVRNRMIYSGYDTDLLIPANARTVGAYFTRACHILEIDGLRFHDLRHEGATRLAENNWSIPQIQTVTLHSSWGSLQRYVNLKKRPERLEYWDILIDKKLINNEKSQRHVNNLEITQAKIAIDKAVLGAISSPYPFIQKQLEQFVGTFKPSKAVTDGLKRRADIDVLLFDVARGCFVVEYTQKAWAKWFDSFGVVDWDGLPADSTHFNFDNLDVLRLDGKRIYCWRETWIDITAYYKDALLIAKDF